MLSRFVIALLPRSKRLLISWLQLLSTVIWSRENKMCHCFHFSPPICHKVMGPDAMIWVFWMLSFKPSFSLSSFALIKGLFSFSLLSAIRVVSSAYLRLLMFLLAILILACDSSSLAFHMMYSTYKSSKQGDSVQPWHTLFPSFEPDHFPMSGSNYCFMTCVLVSQEVGKVVWYPYLFKNFPVYCDSHKGFSIINEADVFLEFSYFLCDLMNVGNMNSGSSAFSESSLYIWKFLVRMLLKPSLENFEHYFASMWNECNCLIVWTFFGIALLCDWNENWLFSVLWPLLSFPNLLTYWVQCFNRIIF